MRRQWRVLLRVVPTLSVVALCLSPAAPHAQSGRSFSGLWILNIDPDDSQDVYGEVRFVRQSQDEIQMTIVDYGSGWFDDTFRDIVSIRPWTFRFGRWGPRRGAADSKQPRTRARWSGEDLVLAKQTFSGAGEFVWVWTTNAPATELIQRQTGRTWDEDFESRRAEGVETRFVRASVDDPALASMAQRMRRSRGLISVPADIVIKFNPEATAILVQCPQQDCSVAEIDAGARGRRRPIPRGQIVAVPIDVESVVEPVPAAAAR
jgi:hypothetical protein